MKAQQRSMRGRFGQSVLWEQATVLNRRFSLMDWCRVGEFDRLRSGVRVDTCSSRPFSLSTRAVTSQTSSQNTTLAAQPLIEEAELV
jgi:hypothetical protein